jgi:hypothetical protein
MTETEPVVAGYKRVRVLRRDPLGEICHAIHEKSNNPVCLRILHAPPEMSADTWAETRYRLVGTLLHLQQLGTQPHMEAVQGVGESDNALWLVTDYLDGATLEERRQTSGAIPFTEALPILKQVAEALDAVHERGMMHSCLCSDRVMFTREGDVCVTGFGLGLIPTAVYPKYAAPELAQNGTPTRAADIYAFGVVMRKAIGSQQMTLALKAVVDRLMEPDPTKRYNRATEAIRDLEEGRIPVPVSPPPAMAPTPMPTAPVAPQQIGFRPPTGPAYSEASYADESMPTVIMRPGQASPLLQPPPTAAPVTNKSAPSKPGASPAVMPGGSSAARNPLLIGGALIVIAAIIGIVIFLVAQSNNGNGNPAAAKPAAANGKAAPKK